MAMNTRSQNTIGLAYAPKGFRSVFPKPISSKRDPVSGATGDKADPGQVWVNIITATGFLYVGVNTWTQITGAGGAGLFSSLVVTPGPITLTGTFLSQAGTFTVNSGAGNNISIGTDNTDKSLLLGSATGASVFDTLSGTAGTSIDGNGAGAFTFFPTQTTGTINIGGTGVASGLVTLFGGTGNQAINLATNTGTKTIAVGGTGANVITIGNTQTGGSIAMGTAMTTGTISIGGTGLQVGTINIAPGTGAQAVNIGTGGTGVKTIHIGNGAIGNLITIGSLTAAANLTLQAGTGGIQLNSSAGATAGNVSMLPATSSTASALSTVTMNNRVGVATFTGFTTAAAGTQDFTITNSTILATSGVFVSVAALSSGNASAMTITGITQAAGSIIVHTTNNGAGALDNNVIISFWVIS